jgi:Putative prokaryotic signal transducing protein
MNEAQLVVVHEFGSQPEAEMAKSALAGAGIDAMIQADSVGGMRTHVAWSGAGFKVLVREEDAVDAHEVLEPRGEASAGER